MYVLVSPFSKSFDDVGLIYLVPNSIEKEISLGKIVEIPLINNIEDAIILRIIKKEDIKDFIFDLSKIKSLMSIKNDNVFLKSYRLELAKWIAPHYFCLIHSSINLFLVKNLREKIKKNKLQFNKNLDYDYSFKNNSKLTKKQEEVYLKIVNSQNDKILLFGVTGSGKTEIYIKLINDALKKGKQSLFLIPEIILTNQISIKAKAVFGDDVLIINSTVAEAKKTQYWLDINSGKAKIIIGTRSALFYPYNNLDLIIIDEEHDNSYISDTNPRYRTIQVAKKITELNKNKLVLGSGTPSINSMYSGLKGEFNLIYLLEKFS